MPPPPFVLDPALDPMLRAATDGEAATHAHAAVAQGRAELFCGLLVLALEAPALDRAVRPRLQHIAEVFADEAPSYEAAALLWSSAGDSHAALDPRRACDCYARAFAYVPERSERALAAVRALVREHRAEVSDTATLWLRGLVRDGVFPHADLARFEDAVASARADVPRDPLGAELEQLSDWATTRARVREIVNGGEFPKVRALLPELWQDYPADSPGGGRLRAVLEAFEALLPAGEDRGEVRYAIGVYESFRDVTFAVRACAGMLEDLPWEDPRALALLDEIALNEPESIDRELIDGCLRDFRLSPRAIAALDALVFAEER